MSATALLWIAILAATTVMSVTRPAWAVALYMATFFAAPQNWWWGEDVPALRYAVFAGAVLAATALMNASSPTEGSPPKFRLAHAAAVGMALNATVVHFFLSSTPRISLRDYTELVKFVVLFFLICQAIRQKRDYTLVVMSMALGAAYIGYEVTVNDRGFFSGGRLEGVGAPGADSANSLACLLLVTVPFTAGLVVNSKLWQKGVAIASAALAVNVILLCNSRGAFISLIGAGLTFLVLARGATRKMALRSVAAGAVGIYLLLGDPEILSRFATTFVGSEERDTSAASRLVFWKAGFAMLADFPLGDGGGAFKYVQGGKYLKDEGIEEERSLHNGYLTVATSWGLQGYALHMLFLAGSIFAAYRTSERCRRAGNSSDAVIGLCGITAASGLMIAAIFGSFLPNEWGYWTMALLVRYAELYAPVPETAVALPPSANVG